MEAEQGYATPEEAVLADWEEIPKEFVTLVGSRIEGDEAHVWLLTNDREPFHEYECVCRREGGLWRLEFDWGGFALTTPRDIKERAAEIRSRSRP